MDTKNLGKVTVTDRTRVQLDLSAVQMLRLNWVMEVCGLSGRKDLFNNALSLLEWAAKESAAGRRIASFDEVGNDRYILSMPALLEAQSYPKGGLPIEGRTRDNATELHEGELAEAQG